MSYFGFSDRLWHWIERWLPSLILIGVALTQIYLARTASLTPWKGGGFGMFSAIDSPTMRVIWAEGLTLDGQILPLDLSSGLDVRTLRRISALPRQSDLEHIATQLLARPIVPTTIRRQAVYQKLKAENQYFKTSGNLDDEISTARAASLISQPLYRLKSDYDPVVPKAVKSLKAVRLQWWRLKFDPTQYRLWAEPCSQVIETGVWR
ncbi:hypothetical protein [Myxosarcina sp. GI1(2024)]